MRCLLCVSGAIVFFISSAGAATWWEAHPDPATWAHEKLLLGDTLRSEFTKKKPSDIQPGSDEAEQFRLWQWLDWARTDFTPEEVLAFRALGENSELRRAVLENIRPEDHQDEVLKILLQMQIACPDCLKELPRLAVAFALVFDQPFPKRWPHRQVAADAVPTEPVDSVARLQLMAELQRARRFVTDLRDFTVNELKFVIDHPLVASEMEWARKNVTASRSGFGKVFSSIRYDIPRYEANQLVWPYPAYTFSEIRSKGGICVDQAYFAANTGKAKGLPTLYFSGQGDDGGHAWFGFMDSPGHWETDCGRYESQNYPVGNAMDPQVWQPISDTELTFLAKGRERSSAHQQAKLLTDIGKTLEKSDPDRWLEAALLVQPEYLPAWKAQGELLDGGKASPEKRVEFWEKYTKRFSIYPDLKVIGQEKLLQLAKERGDEAAVKSLSRQILVQNRTRRFDLGIGAAAMEVGEKIEAGKWSEAETAFRRALREFKGQAGGNLYYGLIVPFVEAALAEGQGAVAKNALAEARRILRPGKDTLVGRSLIELEAKALPEKKRGN